MIEIKGQAEGPDFRKQGARVALRSSAADVRRSGGRLLSLSVPVTL